MGFFISLNVISIVQTINTYNPNIVTHERRCSQTLIGTKDEVISVIRPSATQFWVFSRMESLQYIVNVLRLMLHNILTICKLCVKIILRWVNSIDEESSFEPPPWIPDRFLQEILSVPLRLGIPSK